MDALVGGVGQIGAAEREGEREGERERERTRKRRRVDTSVAVMEMVNTL